MKLKMAPNSVFAILLRSPWWISFVLSLAVMAASRALLPDAYWLFGAMGGVPFLGVGFVALYRQLRAPSARRVEAIVQAVSAMGWRDFSAALEQAYTRDGFTVQRLDGAADLALIKDGRTTLVSARRWKAARQGEEALAALRGAMQARDASECICIALGELSANAQRYARDHQVQLMQAAPLALLLRDLRVP